MAARLEGKRCLVTAAAQGIGRATAQAFAAEGAEVIATDINEGLLAELDGTADLTTERLDVLDGNAIEALAVRLGAVDVLFNCAGFVHHGSVLEASEAEFDFGIELNVKSMFRMIQAFLPAMLAAGGGSVINMASVAGSIKGIVHRTVYGMTKAAVIGLTKSVAADYVGQGVRCNAIAPGTVQTPSLDDRVNAFDDPVAARAAFIARQPMARLGTAEEIAAIATYLAADESAYTTGQIIVVDGGITI
ncbi:MAG: SDR family oxidoreductase [Alphaproteobacteria bacterium]|nr:SDR family oxidoreductase [Alphaproteobacteria bacterium]